MKISKTQALYFLALVLAAGLLVSIVIMVPRGETRYSEVQRDQLLETDSEWIIQFDIINRHDAETNYTIKVLLNGNPYDIQPLTVRSNTSYTYIDHVLKDSFDGGKVTFQVYQEGLQDPIEETTYIVKTQGGRQ